MTQLANTFAEFSPRKPGQCPETGRSCPFSGHSSPLNFPLPFRSIVGYLSRTVFLEMPELRPVMQMKIKCSLTAADGSPAGAEIYNTINKVPAF